MDFNLTPVCSPKFHLRSRRTTMQPAAPDHKRAGASIRGGGESGSWIDGPVNASIPVPWKSGVRGLSDAREVLFSGPYQEAPTEPPSVSSLLNHR
jgi:hypothetical protein